MSMSQTLRDAILSSVNSHQGIKGVELVLQVMGKVGMGGFTEREYQNTLAELLIDGDIVEIEYSLPSMSYRLKSLFFPKGTTFNVPETKGGVSIDDWNDSILHRP